MDRDKNFEINSRLLERLIEVEKNNFAEKYENCSNKDKVDGARFIECENIKIEINGYPVKNPDSKEAKTLKMRIYASLVAKKAVDGTEKEITKNFGHVPIKFSTPPLLMFKALSGIIGKGKSFAVVDIGGEVTDIFTIKNGYLDSAVSFPNGINSLRRNVAKKMNSFLKEAPSVLKMFSENKMSFESSEKVSAAVRESKNEWRKSFAKAVEEISRNGLLPQDVFLIGDEVSVKYFGRHISDDIFSKYAILGKPLAVTKIHAGWLSNHFKFQMSGSCHPLHPMLEDDAVLVFESFFANKNL